MASPAKTVVEGQLKRVVGITLEASGCAAPIGGYCLVETVDGEWLETEVVGFAGDRILLMPTGELRGVMPNARVIPLEKASQVPVGNALLGRIIDGAARPLDSRGPLLCDEFRSLQGVQINPLSRNPIREPLDVGVRAINGVLSLGRGQRIGLCVERVFFVDCVDDPKVVRLLGIDHLGRQEHRLRPLRPDRPRQQVKPATVGHDRHARIGLAKAGRGRGQDHVSQKRNVEPHAKGRPGNRRDDRLFKII